MRVAAILLTVAACSSPATPTAHPHDEVAPSAFRDAAPEVAEVVPASPPCFDAAWIEGVDDGALAFCHYVDVDDYEAAAGAATGAPHEQEAECFAVAADGGVAPVEPRFTAPPASARVHSGGTGVSVCILDGPDCAQLAPELNGTATIAAAATETGKRAAVAIAGEQANLIELWDAEKVALLARGHVPRKAGSGGASDVGLFGEVILLAVSDGATTGTLWKQDGKKLKSFGTLPGDLEAFAAAGPGRAVFVLDGVVTIYQLDSVKMLGSAPLDDRLREQIKHGTLAVHLVVSGDVVGVLLTSPESFRAVASAVVSPLTGQATRIPLPPFCSAQNSE